METPKKSGPFPWKRPAGPRRDNQQPFPRRNEKNKKKTKDERHTCSERPAATTHSTTLGRTVHLHLICISFASPAGESVVAMSSSATVSATGGQRPITRSIMQTSRSFIQDTFLSRPLGPAHRPLESPSDRPIREASFQAQPIANRC